MVDVTPDSVRPDGPDPAQRFTLVRALGHLEADERVRCADHLAQHFLDAEWRLALRFRSALLKRLEANAPGAYGYGLARTGFVDARLRECIADGARQVLILGSGFDSRAYRFGGQIPLDVVELDRAAVHRVKAARAAAAALPEPPNPVVRIPVDFARLEPERFLPGLDLDFGKPVAVLAEGLLYYLPGAFFTSLVRFVGAHAAPGSILVFDFAHAALLGDSDGLYGGASVARFARESGERFHFTTDPVSVAQACADAGLTVTHDFDHDRMTDEHLRTSCGSVLGRPFGGFHLCCARKP